MPNPNTGPFSPITPFAAGDGGVWKEVSSLSVSAVASVSFSGLDDTSLLFMLVLRGMVPVDDAVNLQLQFLSASVDKGIVIIASDVGSDVGEHASGLVYLFSLANTSLNAIARMVGYRIRSSGTLFNQTLSAGANDQTAIDEVVINFSTGNIESGKPALFSLAIS